MADKADIAGEKEQFVMMGNLTQSKKPEGPEPRGYCLNCGPEVKLPVGMRWCDSACRDDWENWSK